MKSETLIKAETRRPRSERNPKTETRNGPSLIVYTAPSAPLNSAFGFQPSFGLRPSAFGFRPAAAFTLIELLIVIAIIAILAAMIIPISGAVNRNKIKAKARVELEQVATAIELYKTKLGHYPPDNPFNPATNQLLFELLGTTFTNGAYATLDGSAWVNSSALGSVFGLAGASPKVGGIINTTQGTVGDEGRVATHFLSGLKPDEVATIASPVGNQVKILVAAVPGPTANYLTTINYVSSSPTNNPNTYDLWVDAVISGKTNRISNWSQQTITLP
jgi:prepilin-type N-terminal cleavage/methylation domain-containing protein